MEIRRRTVVVVAGGRDRDLRRLRIPHVDVESLDLLDKQEDRFTGGAQLLALGVRKTRSPPSQLVDLALVQTLAQVASRRLNP